MIAQFLLRRYNTRVSFADGEIGISQGWLDHRLQLFKSFCLPSVAAQSNKQFTWIIQIRDNFPEASRLHFLAQLNSLPIRVIVIPSAQYSEEVFIAAIRHELISRTASAIVTTRIDNDDAIVASYLEDVLSIAVTASTAKQLFVIDFPDGCQASSSGVYLRRYHLNAFLSVVCPSDDIKTAFHMDHPRMNELAPVVEVPTKLPHWMQALHKRNVGNRLKPFRRAAANDIRGFSLASNWMSVLQAS